MTKVTVRRRVWAGALALSLGLATLFAVTGTLQPERLPRYADSPEQIIGMAAMLILLPGFLVVAAAVARQRSLLLLEELRGIVPDAELVDRARLRVHEAARRTWPLGLGLGILFGFINTDPFYALLESPVPRVDAAISFGQFVLWCTVALLLVRRAVVARQFRELGRVVEIDPFRPDALRPLARSGMVDLIIIALALVFTPLQALDAEFRWVNFRYGLGVALPSAVFLLLWPLQTVHRRLVEAREEGIARVERAIAAESARGAGDATALARLEALLAHRDRWRALHTWPLSSALISRAVLYGIIPPLAWAGAALVERLVDRFLGS